MLNSYKICLIDVVHRDFARTDPPLSLLMLAGSLLRDGLVKKQHIKILNSSLDDIEGEVLLQKPDLIGFSVLTPFYLEAKKVAKKLRKITKATFVIGGYHISALPDSLESPFNIGVIGEGEESFVKLVGSLKKGDAYFKKNRYKIPGLVFRNSRGKNIKTEKTSLVDVNNLPKIEWSLVRNNRIYSYLPVIENNKLKVLRKGCVYTARGCPYQCAFCAHRVLWGGKGGFRLYPINKVGEEIEELYKKHRVRTIHVLDDTFAVTKKRLIVLADELKRRKLLGKISFCNVFIRANLVDEEFAMLLKKIKVLKVFIGIESGSERILRKIKDGPLSKIQIKRAVKLLAKQNILVTGSFMLFSPNETKRDIDLTHNLAKWFSNQKNADAVLVSVTTPYPGTKLWKFALERKLITLNQINWSEFLMFDPRDFYKVPHVFFKGKFSSVERERIFKKFIDLSQQLKRRNSIKNNDKKAIKKVFRKNIEIHHESVKKRRLISLVIKLNKLIYNPSKYIRKFIYESKNFRKEN
jgi:anaerobic magnesium-protoporphyrin IX monomethyl ester cyclase